MAKPIIIVGGGLAGLSLGIGLRQQNIPVTLWEAGDYPRHRVCGEFISGRGQEVLARLGLMNHIEQTGAVFARDAVFFDGHKATPRRVLPQPALCISRFDLDHLLAQEFQRLGGILNSGERWRGPEGEGIVHASGRRVEPVVEGYRWIGLKVHARNISAIADLEFHFLPSGYVGLCRLPGDIWNICGMFRSRTTFPDLSKNWAVWLTGPPDSALHERLASAQILDETFCAVAGLDTRPRKAARLSECRIGDALTMIPPMTGNGMSMALEAAEIAIAPLVAYSRGGLAWPEAQQQIATACNARFARRLFCAQCLHRGIFFPPARTFLMQTVSHSERFSRVLFHLTR